MKKLGKSDENLEVYRRILKYSPFLLKREKGGHLVTHHLEGGGIITTAAARAVSVEDGTKLYALMLNKESAITEDIHGDFRVIVVKCKLSKIRMACNSHDYSQIFKALERIAGLTISYESGKNDKSFNAFVTHIIHSVKMSEPKNEVIALFDADFFRACQEKSLTLHFPTYQQLSPAAKNLYSFLISNSGNVFSEDLLFERCGLTQGRKDDRQRTLKKAMQEIVDRAIIVGHKVEKKNGVRMYYIQRIRESIDA
jgi:hypothetical protein